MNFTFLLMNEGKTKKRLAWVVVFALAARWVCFWHDLERSHKGGARIGSDRIGMTRQGQDNPFLALHMPYDSTQYNTTLYHAGRES